MSVTDFLLMGVGGDGVGIAQAASANPQLQFFENFPAKDGVTTPGYAASLATLSIHAVNIPLSISLNNVVILQFRTATVASSHSITFHWGLYSLNGSTLSLANSASAQFTGDPGVTQTKWFNFTSFSSTQNITPGPWYFALNLVTFSNHAFGSIFANSSANPGNASPVFVRGRMTASTTAMPASIATSALDITGSDASRQPYIIITA